MTFLSKTDKIEITEIINKQDKKTGDEVRYGTAGFRFNSRKLNYVVFTVGILSSLRSKFLDGKTIGVMLTASHNQWEDNGVKIIDPSGSVMSMEWEENATMLATSKKEDLLNNIFRIIKTYKINMKTVGRVIFGRDTRVSGVELSECLSEGIRLFKVCEYQDYGMVTTPQLHYITKLINKKKCMEIDEKKYFEQISESFEAICQELGEFEEIKIVVDGSNGVGSYVLKNLLTYCPKIVTLMEIVNDSIHDFRLLNYDCGADYVKTNKKFPKNTNGFGSQYLHASFDGDADRLVFYYNCAETSNFVLLDGDRISVLFALFLKTYLNKLKGPIRNLKFGVIQTAYSNFASTTYLKKNLKLDVFMSSTGVKYLETEVRKLDIGIYFEANGHGTVYFSSEALKEFENYCCDESDKDEKMSISILRNFIKLINQTVGDAISDLFATLAILYCLKMTFIEWNNLYTDLANTMLIIYVKNKFNFKTIDFEQRLVSPHGLQDEIDLVLKKYDNGRTFVRPSGTENVVRIYSEAKTQENSDKLAADVKALVFKYESNA